MKPSLLKPEVIAALETGGIAPEHIEFLGWLNGNARALNNTKNPVKAAHTLLSREGNLEMLKKFFAIKLDQLAPKGTAEHEAADKVLREFRRQTKTFEPAYSQEEVDSYAPEKD